MVYIYVNITCPPLHRHFKLQVGETILSELRLLWVSIPWSLCFCRFKSHVELSIPSFFFSFPLVSHVYIMPHCSTTLRFVVYSKYTMSINFKFVFVKCLPVNICDSIEPLLSTWTPALFTMKCCFFAIVVINADLICTCNKALSFGFMLAMQGHVTDMVQPYAIWHMVSHTAHTLPRFKIKELCLPVCDLESRKSNQYKKTLPAVKSGFGAVCS
jgi:hypothetical protein